MKKYFIAYAFLALSLSLTGASIAQRSAPQPLLITDHIPASQDIPYPGTISLLVDATDTERAIFRVKQNIPIAKAGVNYLLYPKWLPGKHAPRGAIDALSGLKVFAKGKQISWTRDISQPCSKPRGSYQCHI